MCVCAPNSNQRLNKSIPIESFYFHGELKYLRQNTKYKKQTFFLYFDVNDKNKKFNIKLRRLLKKILFVNFLVKIYPCSAIWCHDSNSQPLIQEPRALTNRPRPNPVQYMKINANENSSLVLTFERANFT